MSTVIATITTTQQTFPSGTQGGVMRFRLMQGGTEISRNYIAATATVCSFGAVADGTGYTVEAVRCNNVNTPIGTPINSASFDVSSTVSLAVPDGVAGVSISVS